MLGAARVLGSRAARMTAEVRVLRLKAGIFDSIVLYVSFASSGEELQLPELTKMTKIAGEFKDSLGNSNERGLQAQPSRKVVDK